MTNFKVEDWAQKIEKKGAGEIILSSIDRDGTFNGIDYDLVKRIKKKIKIPLIVHGGCKSPNDVAGIYNKIKFEGVAISSLFHYHLTKKLKKELIKDLKKQKNFSEGNIEYLVNNKGVYSYLYPNTYTIKKFKRELMKTKIKVRS